MSGVEFEFAIHNGERGAQQEDGDTETVVEEGQASSPEPPPAASRIQGL